MLAALVAMLTLASNVGASAQDLDLAAVARELGSDDAAARHAAIATLSTLPADALPVITVRLARLRRVRPTRDEANTALTAIRRAAGSRRADDMIDIAPGVEVLLATDRAAPTLRMAEPLLLLRSLERLATTEALRVIPAVFRLDGEPWRMEARRVTLRLGDRVAAAAIYARSDDDNPEGRTWARWTTDRLDLDNPGALAQRMGGRDLADVLRAYATTHTLSAIPVVASFVDADQRHLRDAARAALRDYHQNSIWVARETFETRLGEEPDLGWGWERTLDELYARLDAARAAHVLTALTDATAALESEDTELARSLLDRALARSPELATAEAATLYARIALLEDDADRRDMLLRRAIAIAPDSSDAPSWRGRLAFDAAQRTLNAGVLDAENFARAAALAPTCVDCAAMNDALTAQSATLESDRTLPLAIAAGLFAMLGLLVLTWSSTPKTTRAPRPADLAAPLVAADDTLS